MLSSVLRLPAGVRVQLAELPRVAASALAAAPLSTSNHLEAGTVEGRQSSLILTIDDEGKGALQTILSTFAERSINLTRIASKPTKGSPTKVDFFVDFEGHLAAPEKAALFELLKSGSASVEVVEAEPPLVPWFPTKASDIDGFSHKTLDAGAELESDHPGFSDDEYRERRRMIVGIAQNYKHGDALTRIDYTEKETETWGVVYDKLMQYLPKYAVRQYNDMLPQFEKECGYARNNIPQLEDISNFLKSQTGFSLRPVAGLLSARDFLNGLAFRVFFSTQYIRHHTMPLYTPEPDICHELLGHAVMFADPDFAEFSHEIGLASLGATDDEIRRLATCYWFSVEFGLCEENGAKKAYGAGLLSSFGELEYACSPTRPAGGVEEFPKYSPWVPEQAAATDYPITTYQPEYFVAASMTDAKERMIEFCDNLNRPFGVRWIPDEKDGYIEVDRNVQRGEYTITMQK